MIKLILTGAGGRMGTAVLSLLPSFKKIQLTAAIEVKGHPNLGKNVCEGVKLSSDLSAALKNSDVLLDFTGAESSINNLKMASSANKPIIICATGHDSDQRANIVSISKIIPVVCSPNMSVGVNVMFNLVKEAAGYLGKDYKIDIVETHHVHKKDAPSGTAKKLLEAAVESSGYKPTQIPVKSIREGEVVGDHTITFSNPYEILEITHKAMSREVFANGALKAVEWIVGKKPGLYGMGDVLNAIR